MSYCCPWGLLSCPTAVLGDCGQPELINCTYCVEVLPHRGTSTPLWPDCTCGRKRSVMWWWLATYLTVGWGMGQENGSKLLRG